MKKFKKYITYGYSGSDKGKKYTAYCLIFVTALFVLSGLNSCKKLIEPNPSSTKILTSTVFTDSITVQAALAGMYTSLSNSDPYDLSISTIPGFTADELNYVGEGFTQYINNTIPVNDSYAEGIWASSYSVIYIANGIVNGVTNSNSLSAKFKNQAIGEALFVRALCYFYLTNIYGDVPLILSTDVTQNTVAARTPSAIVYNQIINDLKLAQTYLPADYSISSNDRTRANKFAATALLARVYLYTSKWAEAEAQATTIINSSLFSLTTDLNQVFTPNSTEAIFQFYNSSNGYTYYAAAVVPAAVEPIPTYVLSSEQMAAFQTGDKRESAWVGSILYSGTTYYYPYKYKSVQTDANQEYYTVLRLAEQYLIRAEARAEQNNASGAIADLNMVHNPGRVGLPVYSGATDQISVLSAIMKERQVELFSEWGHRWFDLKRTNTADAVLGAEKPTWKPTDVLFPIPTTEIKLDPKLVQNPGY